MSVLFILKKELASFFTFLKGCYIVISSPIDKSVGVCWFSKECSLATFVKI